MDVKMDAAELNAFMLREFEQVVDQVNVEAVTEHGALVRWRVDSSNIRPGGTISGPTMFSAADVGMYMALLSRIGPEALAVTTNCSIDFMRKPAAGADLLADCRLLKLGRVLAVGDVMIFSEGGNLPVARASMTYSIPPK